jgi:hypothetical protein
MVVMADCRAGIRNLTLHTAKAIFMGKNHVGKMRYGKNMSGLTNTVSVTFLPDNEVIVPFGKLPFGTIVKGTRNEVTDLLWDWRDDFVLFDGAVDLIDAALAKLLYTWEAWV